MTTTLRPTAPERRTDDGGRSRTYQICVNSRPVGTVELATDAAFGPTVGRVLRLTVDERERRRGRGTVAALAAEEVLRGWGCARVEIAVDAHATVALGLAHALGYTERNRHLAKTLTTVPRLPEGTEGRPMTEAEFAAWESGARRGYAQDLADRGVPAGQARAKAEADHRHALPDGQTSPGVIFSTLLHRGSPVGILWLVLRDRGPGRPGAHVYDIEVAEAHRRRGHGRSLMLLAEAQALAAGADRLGLNVFAGNTPALRLYTSLGYEPQSHHLYKPLL
ncbi:GNAT family N-acetyltransferase [Streptomyces gamaensis]|uniref:GNAT family N-acetyltransferase n=1 Tax=Streptomyces gamaensis TaxID=1763542 RepID=A0ABW0Z5Q9_9ACTN